MIYNFLPFIHMYNLAKTQRQFTTLNGHFLVEEERTNMF